MITATPAYLAANAKLAKRPIHLLEITGYGKVFSTATDAPPAGNKAWISDFGTLTLAVDDLNGSASISDFSVTVLDYRGLITADFPLFQFEGARATLKTGFPGLAESDYVTLFTGIVNTVASDLENTAYTFTLSDYNRVNQQVIYRTGDDGQPTASDHPKTLVGNPLDLLVDILNHQIGYALGEIDTTTIYAYRDQLFAGMSMQFAITSPPDAKSFLENELLKPLGLYGYTDHLGRYTISSLQPLAGTVTAALTLDKTNLVGVPVMQQADLVNVLSYRFDADADGKFMSETVQEDTASVSLYGQQGQAVIESNGVRSGFGGFSLAGMVARSVFARYGSKNPVVTVTAFWPAALLTPADFIALTHAQVPNRKAGTMGVTAMLFAPKQISINLKACTVDIDLVDASAAASFGTRRYAPAGKGDYTADTAGDKARYLFMSDITGHQSNGDLNGNFG